MRSGMKYMAVAAALLLLTAGSQGAFAGCTNLGRRLPDLPVRVRGLVRPAACRVAGSVEHCLVADQLRQPRAQHGARRTAATSRAPATRRRRDFNGNDSGLFNDGHDRRRGPSCRSTRRRSRPARSAPTTRTPGASRVSTAVPTIPRVATADNDNIPEPVLHCGLRHGLLRPVRHRVYRLLVHAEPPDRLPDGGHAAREHGQVLRPGLHRQQHTRLESAGAVCRSDPEGSSTSTSVINGDCRTPAWSRAGTTSSRGSRCRCRTWTAYDPSPSGTTGDRMLSLSWNNVVVYNDGSVRPTSACRDGPSGRGLPRHGQPGPVRPGDGASDTSRAIPQPVDRPSLDLDGGADDPGPGRRERPRSRPASRCRPIRRCASGRCSARRRGPAPPPSEAAVSAPVVTSASRRRIPMRPPITGRSAARWPRRRWSMWMRAPARATVHVSFRTTSETTVDSISILAVGNRGETVVQDPHAAAGDDRRGCQLHGGALHGRPEGGQAGLRQARWRGKPDRQECPGLDPLIG